MPTPVWLAATAGQPAKAGQINQFLGAHASTLIYTGVQRAAQSTAGAGAVNSNGLYIAQSIATAAGQTAVGRIVLTLAVTGTPAPLTVSLQANVAGAPSGTPLVTTLVPREFLSGTPNATLIPLPATGLTASTTYWIVANAVGDASNYYSWSKSNQVAGTSTSANGTTWTAQAYGLLYQVYDQTPVQPLVNTWEDGGARWTAFAYDTSGRPSVIAEYTAGQSATGYATSLRSLAYTGGFLTGLS